MKGTISEPDPIVPGNGEEHRSAGNFLRGMAPGILRASLYLGLTYLALFAGVGTCQGQCAGDYIYHGHCTDAQFAFSCWTEDPSCNSTSCNYSMFQQYCWDNGSTPDDIQCTCYVPPPTDVLTIGDSVICTGTGSDGWCSGSADLVLSFADSRGDGVTGINGTIGGTGFSCGPLTTGQSCIQHLPEGQGNIDYSGICTGGQTASGSDTWKLDLTPPVITPNLTGGTPGNNGWYRGGPVSLSCSATDALSGLFDLVYGSRTATGEGSTTLSCTARDAAGNTANASPTVQIDSGAPSAAIVYSDSPAASGWYIMPVTVSLQASDGVSGIYSSAIRVNGDGWEASRTLGDGVYAIEGLAEDYAGNTASTSGTVRVDSTPPTATWMCNGSPCGSGWYAGPVTVSLNATDLTSGLASAMVSTSGTTWSGSASLTDGVTVVQGRAVDNAGNVLTLSQTVRIDGTAPSTALLCNGSPCGSGWYRAPVALSLGATDAASGVASAQVSLDGGATWVASLTLSDGTYSVQGRASDAAGNIATTSGTVQVDSTPPSISWMCNDRACDDGWYTDPVTVSLGADDGAWGSGVGSAQISLDGGTTWHSSLTLADGTHTLQGRASDAAGNTATGSRTVRIDRTAPSIMLLCNGSSCGGGWYAGSVTVSLGADDGAGGSGVVSAQISFDGGATWVAELTLADGTYPVQGRASDAAGNAATISGTVQVDSAPPTIQWKCNDRACADGWYMGSVVVSLEASDAASGVAVGSALVSGDGGATWVSSLTLVDGTHLLQGRAGDTAGNTVTVSRTVRIDRTAPSITLICNGSPCDDGWYTGPVAVSLGADDGPGGSGVASAQISLDRGFTWVALMTLSDGVYDVWGRASDAAGNASTIRDIPIRVDATAPISAWSIADGIWVGGDVPLRGTSADATSGVARVEISFDNGVTWTPAGTGSSWTYTWQTYGEVADTAADGAGYPLLARAWDVAGNLEHTAIVHLRVDNTPPSLALPYPVMGYDPTRAQFLSGDAGSGVARARVTFSGNGIAPLAVEYPSPAGVETIAWNGRDGDGHPVPAGIYDVQVEVWDAVGNRAGVTGRWVRPASPTEALTPTCLPTDTPGPRPSAADTRAPSRGTATDTSTPAPGAVRTATSTRAPIPVLQLPQLPPGIPAGLLFLPAVAAAFWLVAGGAAFGRDRRGEELRALRRSVEAYLTQRRTNFKGGEDND